MRRTGPPIQTPGLGGRGGVAAMHQRLQISLLGNPIKAAAGKKATVEAPAVHPPVLSCRSPRAEDLRSGVLVKPATQRHPSSPQASRGASAGRPRCTVAELQLTEQQQTPPGMSWPNLFFGVFWLCIKSNQANRLLCHASLTWTFALRTRAPGLGPPQ